MTDLPKPPQTYEEFTGRFPELAEAWQMIGAAFTWIHDEL